MLGGALPQARARIKTFVRIRIVSGVLGGIAYAGAAFASLPPRAPGLWQSTTTVRGLDGKPLANATDVVTLSCVDPATDMKFFMSGGQSCTKLAITGSQQHFSIDGTCRQMGRPVNIRETLDYASAKQVTLTAYLDSPAGMLKLVSELQWQGACLAGMKPGDEGSVVNGAFSKADNIGDAGNF